MWQGCGKGFAKHQKALVVAVDEVRETNRIHLAGSVHQQRLEAAGRKGQRSDSASGGPVHGGPH